MEHSEGFPTHGRVLFGGCVLAALAAAVNMDFMIRLGVSVSHLTGDFSRITLEAATYGHGSISAAATLAISVFGFVCGATMSGFFIHHPAIDIARPYGRSIVAIGILLLLAHRALGHDANLGCLLAAGACGFQNALATRFRGVILRTTHITGLLTDLGQSLGMRLRGHRVECWKIAAPMLLALSFATGSASAALLQIVYKQPILPWCGGVYLLGGALWSAHKRLNRRANQND